MQVYIYFSSLKLHQIGLGCSCSSTSTRANSWRLRFSPNHAILSILVGFLLLMAAQLQAQPQANLSSNERSPYYPEFLTEGLVVIWEKATDKAVDTVQLTRFFWCSVYFIPHPDTLVFLENTNSSTSYVKESVATFVKSKENSKVYERKDFLLNYYVGEESISSTMQKLHRNGYIGKRDTKAKERDYGFNYIILRQRAWDALTAEEKARQQGMFGETAEKQFKGSLVFPPDTVKAFQLSTARDSALYQSLMEAQEKAEERSRKILRHEKIARTITLIKAYEYLSAEQRIAVDSKVLDAQKGYWLNDVLHPLDAINGFPDAPWEIIEKEVARFDTLSVLSLEDRLLYEKLWKRAVALEAYTKERKQKTIESILEEVKKPNYHKDFRKEFYLLDANRVGFKEKVHRDIHSLFVVKPEDFVDRIIDLRYDLSEPCPNRSLKYQVRIAPIGDEAMDSCTFPTLMTSIYSHPPFKEE